MRLETFKLENYEGPLDFLLHLIQKKEIDIYQVSLKQITDQYLNRLTEDGAWDVESGAEVIGQTAFLLWLKSKTLLPKHEQDLSVEEDELDPRFEVIHKLIEYCCFKEAAKNLAEREQLPQYFYRGELEVFEAKKPAGVHHLSLEDLGVVFSQILSKRSLKQGIIREEEWKVSDKIKLIKSLLKQTNSILFSALFDQDMSKNELIVTFLAVLELMKLNEIKILFDESMNEVKLCGSEAAL